MTTPPPPPPPPPELSDADRDRFDALLEDVLDELPAALRRLIDRVPLIVDDVPEPELVEQLIAEGTIESEADALDLCGLHSGTPITDRGIDDTPLTPLIPLTPLTPFSPLDHDTAASPASGPESISLFRCAIIDLAVGEDGFDAEHADQEVYEEIRITLLHEIGHHYGLSEEDLERLGYG
jgi:predicted Zn-dependent protease with MMP-like domain